MDVRNVGLIGLGDIGKVYLSALEHCTGLRLVAIADPKPIVETEIPFGVRLFNNVKDMYKQCTLSAVIIATPHHTHAKIAVDAIFEGLHVLVEKPMATSRHDFGEIMSAGRERGKVVCGALHASYGREIEWLLSQRCEFAHKASPLTNFVVHLSDPYMRDGKVTEKGNALGTPWLDSGVNALSILSSIIPIFNVSDISLVSVHDNAFTNNIFTIGSFAFETSPTNRGEGTVTCAWGEHLEAKFTHLEFADKTSIVLNHTEEAVRILDADGIETFYESCSNERPRLVNQYVRVLNDFATALHTKNDNLGEVEKINHHFFAVLDGIERLKMSVL